MKTLIVSLLGMSCFAFADEPTRNVSVFLVEGIREEYAGNDWIRHIQLKAVTTITGSKYESFEFTATGKREWPNRKGHINSRWFYYPVVAGQTIIVRHTGILQNPIDIVGGKEYVDDYRFLDSVRDDYSVDVKARRAKLDQFLAGHDGVIHANVAEFIGLVVYDSGFSNDVWSAYVKGNPLRLKNEAHFALFDKLSHVLIDERDSEGRSIVDQKMRRERSDLCIGEWGRQMEANEVYTDIGVGRKSVGRLAKLWKTFPELYSAQTKAEIEKLLNSDRLSSDQKSQFR